MMSSPTLLCAITKNYSHILRYCYNVAMSSNFLREYITTRNFSIGEPRSFTAAGNSLFFLRSKSAANKTQCLFRVRTDQDELIEELIIDPADDAGNIPLAERQRRERLRETAAGIVAYSVDETGQTIVFAAEGCIWVASEQNNNLGVEKIPDTQGAFDPRLSPDGSHVAYVLENALYVRSLASATTRRLTGTEDPAVTWGMAEFIAAEEIGRQRGFWWSPDSRQIVAAKVDNRPVREWHISDPSQPGKAPQTVRYPAAGTPNAVVDLAVFSVADETPPIGICWDASRFEYLVDVYWDTAKLLVMVQSRGQKQLQILEADPLTGQTTPLQLIENEKWVELLPGVPGVLEGKLFFVDESSQGRRLVLDDAPATPAPLLVRACHGQAAGQLIFSAYAGDPKKWEVWTVNPAGQTQKIKEAGVYAVTAAEDIIVIKSLSADQPVSEVAILRWHEGQFAHCGTIKNTAAAAPFTPAPRFFVSGQHQIHSSLLLPSGYKDDAPLPVLLRPYGGPHGQQVLAASKAYLLDQWYADQGFAVVIADGRGTPGHTPEWEKALAGDLIGPVLEDQIAALQDIAAHDDRLDLSKVGIAGWSFGGYLAAFALLRHPDVFRAAVAGAPVTDWRLYDTHYSERYLGDPAKNEAAYQKTSLIRQAAQLKRPLMIIHGLADDNVVVANSLQFSAALWEADAPHEFILLPGATHMVSDPSSAEHIEKIQLQFFKRHLQ